MSRKPTAVVTGAGGFIGGRAVEVLHVAGLAEVRAVVRRWATAARVGRLPVQIVRADVMDPTDARQVVAGADVVFHCARAGRDVNVEGTRNVLEAALAAGVRRVVHLSTIEVYGNPSGSVDEAHPLTPTGREYGDSKIEAERFCAQYGDKGLEIVILRPTVVYGPFSDLWTIEFATRFQAGPFLPRLACEGACNLVYIDDVVGAMLRAWKTDAGVGRAFNVNGPDRVTWNEYFDALNDALGLPPLVRAEPGPARRSAAVMSPVRKAAKFALRNFNGPIMALYQRSNLAKRAMKGFEARIRRTPTAAEFSLYSRSAYYECGLAREVMGFKPAFDMGAGVELSARWLRHARYV